MGGHAPRADLRGAQGRLPKRFRELTAEPTSSQGPHEIRIQGAREHNLRDLTLSIPRDALVVITGPSGSGKSSLAFDTLFAEGQRRYVESLSAYARQFMEQLAKPDVDAIDGLSPAISIEQKTVSRSPRSTVGTATEIYDFLRLLFARAGTPTCHRCGLPIESQSLQQMCDRALELPEGSRLWVLAPLVRGRRGQYKKELEELRRRGFVRARIDGELRDLSDDIELAKSRRHDIDVVVDRLAIKAAARGRLSESIETALSLSDGTVVLAAAEGDRWQETLLSRKSACAGCGLSYPELEPRTFSFNSPAGACPTCNGLGTSDVLVVERVVPDPTLSLAAGAIEPWRGRASAAYYRALLNALSKALGIDLDTPWRDIPASARRAILTGDGIDELEIELVRGRRRKRAQRVTRDWDGVAGELARLEEGGDEERIARYREPASCPDCGGDRLRLEARHVHLASRSLPELARLPVAELAHWLAGLALESPRAAVAERVLEEIRERLRFLEEVGLGYLSLDRPSATLSGGEGQRVRLATQIGASLMGVLFVLDEPSIGLHPRDHRRLLASLVALRDLGNSVVVVEHDRDTIEAADHVVDMGPGAGVHGGQIVAEGSPDEIRAHPDSLTGAYLSGRRAIPTPERRCAAGRPRLVLRGCREHNLKDVTLELPLGCFTAVTGVSGSGKSTLVNDTLHRALAARLHGATERPGAFSHLEGLEQVDKVINISQAPIGRSPRSNPATYSGAFDGIRRLLAQVPEARMRGYGPGRFSFNVADGRCETCRGDGAIRVEMHFLPDLFVRCDVCGGRRYERETLEVRYKGLHIAEILDLSVEDALAIFEHAPSVRRPLQALHDVGLDYLHLGQAATTLSGGEAQRVKLARELARKPSGHTLYLLDEPTTGLHFADVEKLLEVLHKLVDLGHSVVVIEHQLDVVKSADFVIDLGPEGGELGGEIVARGTPEEIARCERSHTGRALAERLLA